MQWHQVKPIVIQYTYQEGVTALYPGKRRCACNAGHSSA